MWYDMIESIERFTTTSFWSTFFTKTQALGNLIKKSLNHFNLRCPARGMNGYINVRVQFQKKIEALFRISFYQDEPTSELCCFAKCHITAWKKLVLLPLSQSDGNLTNFQQSNDPQAQTTLYLHHFSSLGNLFVLKS